MGNGTIRVRKNVHTLGAGKDDLYWYGQAVAVMQKRKTSDPTSWQYQAGIHGYVPSKDPHRHDKDPLPLDPEQKRFWNKCQHGTWYFLPWHRGYLGYFEQIVAAAVVEAGGPPGWALPYWNYSVKDPKPRLMPDAFVPAKINGSDNPLYLAGRNSSTSDFQLDDDTVSVECLGHSPFKGANNVEHGFGGLKTVFMHNGHGHGRLELTPHGAIHDAIGGLMGDPDTAALDPIFWLHHANIDRLWEVWTHRDKTFVNPNEAAWLTGVTFELHDAAGVVQSYTSDAMQDTAKVLHGYVYDDIADPLQASPHLLLAASRIQLMATVPQTPQQVGASQTDIPLTATVSSALVEFHPQTVQATRNRLLLAAPLRPPRVYLNLENVTGQGQPGTYRVYIDTPSAGHEPNPDDALFAGLLTTFGVEAASRADGAHDGSGITTALEITPLVDKLRSENRWDESKLHVYFVKKQGSELEMARVRDSNLKVGRVSVYYS